MAKDDRKVIRGVFVHHAEGAEIYADGDEDLLEEVVTPERGEQLLEAGDLAGGGWKFKGKPPEPMPGSRMARAREKGPDAVKALEAEQERRAKARELGGRKELRRRELEVERAAEAVKAAEEAERERAKAGKQEAKAEAKAEHAPHGRGK